MDYCTTFDAELAAAGPAAVFLLDPEGAWRFDASWTRDLYGRAPGPHPLSPGFVLARDRGSDFVMLVHLTAPTLIMQGHPRLDCRWFEDQAEASAVLASLGSPPLRKQPW